MRGKPRREIIDPAPVTERNYRLSWWGTYEHAKRCTHILTDKNGVTRRCLHDRAPGLEVCRIHKRRR